MDGHFLFGSYLIIEIMCTARYQKILVTGHRKVYNTQTKYINFVAENDKHQESVVLVFWVKKAQKRKEHQYFNT